MGEITAITRQKNNAKRCSIFVDGRFYCGMRLETVLANRLRCGQEVEASDLDRMQFESESGEAFDRALTHISSSMKTRRQMEDFLRGKGYVPAVIDDVLRRLEEYGYVDDAEYARAYAEGARKDSGRRAVEAGLLKRGVPAEIAAEAAAGISDAEEEETALRLLRKYMRGKEPDEATLRRAARYLSGRGFGYETVRAALRGLPEETDEDA